VGCTERRNDCPKKIKRKQMQKTCEHAPLYQQRATAFSVSRLTASSCSRMWLSFSVHCCVRAPVRGLNSSMMRSQ
jgi:hypothetical protein